MRNCDNVCIVSFRCICTFLCISTSIYVLHVTCLHKLRMKNTNTFSFHAKIFFKHLKIYECTLVQSVNNAPFKFVNPNLLLFVMLLDVCIHVTVLVVCITFFLLFWLRFRYTSSTFSTIYGQRQAWTNIHNLR